MKFTIQQIAELVGGEVKGNGSLSVSKLAKIDEEAPEESICFLANPKYENYIYETSATAVIVQKNFNPKKPVKSVLILVEDPYTAFSRLLDEYDRIINELSRASKKGIEQPSFISENLKQGKDIYIGAFSYIGNFCILGDNVKIYPQTFIGDNVSIGSNTIIYAGVKVYANSEIGANCTIHAGAIIGSEGFGFAPQPDGSYKSIPQLGNVILEDNVSIGANTTIDRATIGATIIRKGAKLDNLIQIGHNVEIGENTVIAAQTGISGSTKVGKNCALAGQVGLAGHLDIADNTRIGAQSGINSSIKKEGTAILGYPAFEYKGFIKSSVIFRRLPDLQKRIEELEEKIVNLTSS